MKMIFRNSIKESQFTNRTHSQFQDNERFSYTILRWFDFGFGAGRFATTRSMTSKDFYDSIQGLPRFSFSPDDEPIIKPWQRRFFFLLIVLMSLNILSFFVTNDTSPMMFAARVFPLLLAAIICQVEKMKQIEKMKKLNLPVSSTSH